MSATIKLPDQLNAENVFRFATELDDLKGKKEVVIEMGEPRYFAPFPMLFIAMKLKSFKALNPACETRFKQYAGHTYAGHMGFFKMCGADFGKDVGQADGSVDYIPISRVSREELYESPSDRFEELPDLIQRHVDRVGKIITRDDPKHRELFEIISYSVREIFRNVFEHSEAHELYYCGQYWWKSNKLEVAIADSGIGIRQGLGTNPNFRFDTDKEALEYSLLPGVSGKTHLPRRSETWFNSGYGLYMTNRLARHGGNFAIASGSKAIVLTAKTKLNYDTSFPGTIIRLNFDVSKIGSVQARLKEFGQDAKKIAASIKGTGNRPPSAMSLLLRRDYK